MTDMSQPAYVRRALVEPEPPPLPGGDALTWTRARLFDGVFNTMLTIVSGVLIVVAGVASGEVSAHRRGLDGHEPRRLPAGNSGSRGRRLLAIRQGEVRPIHVRLLPCK